MKHAPAHRSVRTLIIVLGIVLGVCTSVVGSVAAYFKFALLDLVHYDLSVNRSNAIETNLDALNVDNNIRAGFSIPVLQQKEMTTFLLIGTDRQSRHENGRSDAMMLLTINNRTKAIHIASLMRAIYVSIPDEPDPGMESALTPEFMLNAAHAWGGARLLIRTIERNFRVQIDGYFEIDFEGFIKAIDAIGGIDMELRQAEANILNHDLHRRGYHAGMMHLDGEAALSFSRIRKIDTDFVRTSRQRRVIEAIIQQKLKRNPGKAAALASAVLPHVTTNVPQGDLMSYLTAAPTLAGYSVDQLMIPIDDTARKVYISGMEMYKIDFPANIKALHRFMQN